MDSVAGEKQVYWHRELPPLDADPAGEHVVEASSDRVPGFVDRHGDLWEQCYLSLMANTARRLSEELARLDGHFAHVLDEHIDGKRDDVTVESWLHGRFTYMLYRRTPAAGPEAGPTGTRA